MCINKCVCPSLESLHLLLLCEGRSSVRDSHGTHVEGTGECKQPYTRLVLDLRGDSRE